MIERNHPVLSVGAQCRLLSISRSSFYYEPQGETEMNLALMVLIDKQFLETPFYGVQQMTWHLRNEGHAVNVQARPAADAAHASDADLPEARHQQAREGAQDLSLSAGRAAGGAAQPGLVRRHHLPADAPGLSLSGGDHGLVHPQGAGVAHLEHAGGRLLRRGAERGDPQVRPARDHEHRSGSQFTSFAWTDRLKRVGTRISMDGKGRCLDNIFIERLWRSLKYECVYLHAWETGSQAKAGVGRWITFYNHQRPHAAHGGQPPAVVYFNSIETDQQVQGVA